jgi:hypothetical protein
VAGTGGRDAPGVDQDVAGRRMSGEAAGVRVGEAGEEPGKEFGEKLKDMVETTYKNIADSIPYYKSEVRGNSRILYVLKSIEPICE